MSKVQPAGIKAIGVLLGHLEDAILSDGDTPARESLDRADPWWSLDADVGRFRRRQFFRLSTLDRFAMDSPLEDRGFELPVPPEEG